LEQSRAAALALGGTNCTKSPVRSSRQCTSAVWSDAACTWRALSESASQARPGAARLGLWAGTRALRAHQQQVLHDNALHGEQRARARGVFVVETVHILAVVPVRGQGARARRRLAAAGLGCVLAAGDAPQPCGTRGRAHASHAGRRKREARTRARQHRRGADEQRAPTSSGHKGEQAAGGAAARRGGPARIARRAGGRHTVNLERSMHRKRQRVCVLTQHALCRRSRAHHRLHRSANGPAAQQARDKERCLCKMVTAVGRDRKSRYV